MDGVTRCCNVTVVDRGGNRSCRIGIVWKAPVGPQGSVDEEHDEGGLMTRIFIPRLSIHLTSGRRSVPM